MELGSKKYTHDEIKEEFEKMVTEHNKLYNPDGRPHSSADNKHSASIAGLPGRPGDTGVEIPEDPSAPQTGQELAAKDGPVSMITIRNQQFHFTNSGHLWLLATSDDVLPCGLCVALIYGQFNVNEHVALERNK